MMNIIIIYYQLKFKYDISFNMDPSYFDDEMDYLELTFGI